MKALDLLMQAHNQAALNNDNASSGMVKQMAVLGENFEKAVAAALLSLGGPVHGPTKDARHVIFHATDDEICARLKAGKMIPGFGNHFWKETVDPAFEQFFKYIQEESPEIWARLEHVIDLIEDKVGKRIFPNAAGATAITAELMGLAKGTEIQLLIFSRLDAWAKQWSELAK